ncbi:MAG: ABC transporter ATP-binding protein [Akkermansia sp.]
MIYADFGRYFKYLKTLKKLLIGAVLSGVLVSITSGFAIPGMIAGVFPVIFGDKPLPLFLQNYVASMVAPENLQSTVLMTACLCIPLLFAIRGGAMFFNGYLTSYVGMKLLEILRTEAFSRLQYLPLAYHEKKKRGQLMMRLLSDTSNVQTGITQVANDLIKQPLTLISALGYLLYLSSHNEHASILLVNLFFISLSIIPIRFLGNRVMKKSRQVQEQLGDITSVAQENLSSQREVRSYGMQEQQVGIFRSLIARFIRLQLKSLKYGYFMMPALEGISAIGLCYLLVKGASMGLAEEEFLSIALALFMCYDPIKRLGASIGRLKNAQASLNRLNEILNEPDNMPEPKNPLTLGKSVGHVRFDHVDFAYTDDRDTLSEINVDILPGQVVALVGPSGAGKTTFASLIPRFYDVKSGQVCIDGIDIKKTSKSNIRKNIALVSQSSVLFHGSIMDNIRMGRPNATDEEVRRAAEEASVTEFVDTLPNGFKTQLGDGGSGLSGGQRQRVAIARAFLKDAPILILDEATASLDSESESKIQIELDRLVKGRTTFIIAHRFSSIRIANRILVFEAGRIIADGSHEDLYVTCPLYKELYDRQSL